MQKRWWLGFVGLIGLWKLPTVIAAFRGDGGLWDYQWLTWLIWLLYFIPERR
jgi:hypothetical protein